SLLSAFPIVLVAPSCAPSPSHVERPAPTSADPSATTVAAATPSAHGPRRARVPSPRRAPPPIVTTPLAGEPSGRAVQESRLVASSCEQASASEIEGRLKAMRAAVDASFKTWHDSQPACWEEMREEFRLQRQLREA